MVNKALLGGVIGFLLGGLVVSTAAVILDKDENKNTAQVSTAGHNAGVTSSLKDLSGDEFDKAFIKKMISHHQGAIDMARLAETNAKHDEVKKLGQDIISAQTSEIDMMLRWQGDWGYKTVPQSDETHDM